MPLWISCASSSAATARGVHVRRRVMAGGLLAAIVLAGSAVEGRAQDAQARAAHDVRVVEVVDAQGAPVAGAVVSIGRDGAASGFTAPLVRVVTRDDGRATVDGGAASGPSLVVRVEAPGFATAREPWVASGAGPLVVMLQPVGFVEQVSVTAGRRLARGAELPADATVLQARDIEGVASSALDDVLRLTPGFSLFRRNSSRSANPTTQGVTLRGLSASGASRTLVLADGVPLNDPFGGWVSWNRVPAAAIERVEVVRGGSSDLYGADAAGGVVQVVTIEPAAQPMFRVLGEAGTQETGRLSAFGASGWRGWRAGASGEVATTEGGIPIAPEIRGPIDTRAGSASRAATLSILAPTMRGWQAGLRGGVHSEDRTNGTPLQENDTNQRQVAGDVSGRAGNGDLRVRAFAAGQGYDQSFSAVAADRASESLTLRQQVTSRLSGGSGEYLGIAGRVTWLGGVDLRRVTGDLTERNAFGGLSTPSGTQTQTGAFGQATWTPGTHWILVGGLRADRIATDTSLARSVTRTAVSPKVSLAWAPRADTTVRGSVFRAFRVPTLNERLRSFRVGNVVTQNNPALDTEDVRGGELSVQVDRQVVSGRVTGFVTQLDDAITNVTVSRTPTLITRQRRNAGTIDARGVEFEGIWRPRGPVRLAGTFTLTHAEFSDAVEPGLAGRTVPQVPSAQGALDVRWQAWRDTAVSAQVRWIGRQFDDDLNAFELGQAWMVDLLGERRLTARSRVFVAVENLFDEDYDTGRTPQRTVGLPRRVRVGVRVQ